MDGLKHLLSGALRRHHIDRAVTAAMVVERANELLKSVASPALCEDARVVVYRENELLIACANSAAAFDVQSAFDSLRRELEQSFPECRFTRIRTVIRPESWYNGSIV